MAKIILASHGELSKGMLNSILMIVGDMVSGIETYSLYPGENPLDYAQQLKAEIENNNNEYVIVCDIKGGSIYNALLQTCINERVNIIAGMNMNMVLELVLTNRAGNINITQAVDSGLEGISLENITSLTKHLDDEEF